MKVGDLVRVIHGDHESALGLVIQTLRTSSIIMMTNGKNRLFSKKALAVVNESR